MKRIKQIIESFINIGQDPSRSIASAWARIAASATNADGGDLALIDRLIAGILQQAADMQKKASTSPADSEGKS